jgi:multidrug resistance efflux pump
MLRTFRIWLVPLVVTAGSYMAKVEPYDTVTIKAAAAGAVLEANTSAEGRVLHGARLVHIDDRIERSDLENARRNRAILSEMLELDTSALKVLEETMKRQKAYFERMRRLSTASQTQKDNAYNAYASAFNQYVAMREKVLSLRKQLNDTDAAIVRLEDTIEKKSIEVTGFVGTLKVRKGDYVAPGTPIARIDDTSKAKLVLFVPQKELEGIENKTVLINGKTTDYKVSKVWRVSDEVYMSSYRVEIVIDAPKDAFSKLVKVELK